MGRFKVVAACTLVAAAGCDSSKSPVAKASYDPAAAARGMLDEYDKNKSQSIEGAELDACPSLKTALANFDTNKDKKVDLDELISRFTAYGKTNFGTNGINVRVTFNGNPLADAVLTFTPEKCFADTLQGGKALTTPNGVATPKRDDGAPGLSPGLYRVTVTGSNVPPEYGTQNLLGLEVGIGGRENPTVELKLSSKPR